jgi:hypothetical protein
MTIIIKPGASIREYLKSCSCCDHEKSSKEKSQTPKLHIDNSERGKNLSKSLSSFSNNKPEINVTPFRPKFNLVSNQ